MLPDEQDAACLWDMLTHPRKIEQSMRHAAFEDYLANEMLRMATERRIEIIGEAAQNVSAPFRDAHPEIPWIKIIKTRHIFAHEYGELKQDVVYRIATQHVTELVEQLEPLIPPLPPELPTPSPTPRPPAPPLAPEPAPPPQPPILQTSAEPPPPPEPSPAVPPPSSPA